PAYTQPVMYERIRQTPTARQRYADQLVRERVVDAAQAAAEADQVHQRLIEIQQSLKAHLREAGAGEEPQRISGAQTQLAEPDTAVSAPLLTTLNEQLLLVPEGFTIIPKLQKQLERRRPALAEGQIEWAHAEALAVAPHPTPPAWLRGPGTRALECPHRAISRARRRREYPYRQLHDAGAVLPFAAAPGAPRRAAAARVVHAEEPVAAAAGELAARGAGDRTVPAGARRPRRAAPRRRAPAHPV